MNKNTFPDSYIVFHITHELKLFKMNYWNRYDAKAD